MNSVRQWLIVGKQLRVYTLIIFTEITKLFERIVFVELNNCALDKKSYMLIYQFKAGYQKNRRVCSSRTM